MMNNMAVLQLRLGNTQEAKRLMREALEEGAEEEALLSSVTMRFNMARVHEVRGPSSRWKRGGMVRWRGPQSYRL